MADKSDYEKAYDRALLILSYRANSEKELKDKLLRKFDREDVREVIGKVKKDGYLDDEAFAKSYIENSKKGKRLIKLELYKKGIGKETVKKTLELKSEDIELENALFWAEKIVEKRNQENPKIILNKVYETLTRKGYSYEIYLKVGKILNINHGK